MNHSDVIPQISFEVIVDLHLVCLIGSKVQATLVEVSFNSVAFFRQKADTMRRNHQIAT